MLPLPLALLQGVQHFFLAAHAQVNQLAGLRHVVGELLVAARERLAQRRLDALQLGQQLGVAVAEAAHGKAHGLAQAGHVDRAGFELGGHLGELPAVLCQALLELLGGLRQGLLAGSHQRVDHTALLAGGVLDRCEQGVECVQDAGAFLEQGVVARHALRHFLAQLRDHFGRCLRRLAGGVDQAGDGRFERRAQAGQVGGDRGL